jgi:hypothetical protein
LNAAPNHGAQLALNVASQTADGACRGAWGSSQRTSRKGVPFLSADGRRGGSLGGQTCGQGVVKPKRISDREAELSHSEALRCAQLNWPQTILMTKNTAPQHKAADLCDHTDRYHVR